MAQETSDKPKRIPRNWGHLCIGQGNEVIYLPLTITVCSVCGGRYK